MEYLITKNGIVIDANRNIVPMEEGNPAYEDYLNFLNNDGTVKPTDMLSDYELRLENKVPQTASKMRFFLALLDIGITRQMINNAIGQIKDEQLREVVSIKFDLSQEFDRDDQHLNMMAGLFGITDEQLDQLFINSQ